ncbi:tRNA-binding protein [Aquimarina brevivitae]|uniref:tRNA-binding protein n=1 Tax=Aquimarina brevivitae TaxID=323412 RepID=A0A4Q7P1L0_9FLAO|nr:tRNA-binding protein [Aquimarina brevivitae]RZS93731.1 tRNA-binding protein [Aquimarina brevivitae]
MSETTLSWSDFEKVDMRIGTIIDAQVFEEVSKPAYKLWIDFGAIGTKKTSAQITQLYEVSELIGKQVVAVINFPPKQIANFMSECLLIGGLGDGKEVILIQPDRKVCNGTKIS